MAAHSLRESKKIETRDSIARAALDLFLERGFDATSIAEIADAARVSKMTVFNYFPLKEDLFFFRAGHIFPNLATAVRSRADNELISEAVRRYVLAEFEQRSAWTGLEEAGEPFTKLLQASTTLSVAVHRHWQPVRQDLTEALRADGRPGNIPSDVAPVVAAQILSTVEALVEANRLFVIRDRATALQRAIDLAESAFAVIKTGK